MRLKVSKNIISGRRNCSMIRHFLILEVQSDTAILMGGHRQGTNILHLEVPICNFLETLQNLGNAFCNGNAGTLLCTSTLYHVSVPNLVFDHHLYQYHQVHSIYMCCSPSTGDHCITNSNNDQLPVSLIAYVVDRALHQYAGSWIQNSLKPGFFPGFLFVTAFTSDYTCTTIKVQSMTVNVTHEYQGRQH